MSWFPRLEVKFLAGNFDGGLLRFEFRLNDRPLAGSLYPAQVRLFRRDRVRVLQMGHGHTFDVDGPVYRFKQPLIHDDRKPLERWVASQLSYSALEARRIASRDSYRFRDRLRELGVMPVIAGATGLYSRRRSFPRRCGCSLCLRTRRIRKPARN